MTSIEHWKSRCVASYITHDLAAAAAHREPRPEERHDGEEFMRNPKPFVTHESFLFSSRLFCLLQVMRLRPSCVVDIGCGNPPALLLDLRRNAGEDSERYTYIGIDSRPPDDVLPDGDACRLTATFGTGLKILHPRSCSCIVASEFIEHLEQEASREVLGELAEALEPNGSLILTTPCYDGLAPCDMTEHLQKFGHRYYWSMQELRGFLQARGLRVTIWPARFIRDERSWEALLETAHGRGDECCMELLEELATRFNKQLVLSLFAHLCDDWTEVTHLNVVASRKP